MTLCNVMPLSGCIKTETVTENLQPFPALQRYMSIVVPYLQRILCHEYKPQYKVLKKSGILSMWEHLHCNSVSMTGGPAQQVVLHNRWSCTTGGLTQQVVLHNRWSGMINPYKTDINLDAIPSPSLDNCWKSSFLI